MLYLITGGAGFIGSNFVKQTLNFDKKAKVIVLDAMTYAGNLNNLKVYLENEEILIPKTYEKLEVITRDMKGKILAPSKRDSFINKRIKQKLKGFKFKYTSFQDITSKLKSNFTSNENNSRLKAIVGNIIDSDILEAIMPFCDIVVNFAAETHVDRSILSPDEFIKTDVYGTYMLLEAARKSSKLKKFIHISTDEVYGVAAKKSFVETDPINPRNPYSASKAAADRLVYAYNQTYGLPVNIVRLSNNFGPYQYPEKLIPVMIIKALNDEFLPVYGDGKQIRDWLYVKDAAKAIELVIKKAKIGETYNIAGQNERENIEIVHQILKKLDKPFNLIKYVRDRPGHDRRYSLDDSKIRLELGFYQEGLFEEKLDYTIQWYLDNKNWWEKIINEDKEYKEFVEKWYKERS